ncbi:MAG: hypothetical protein GY708_13315 [Actinomycetia bacterium]|nr:hypothetical protein [Actinomycetes bacterium]MCP4963281.1 hypothetical protein [Actinomycetes bacterium]
MTTMLIGFLGAVALATGLGFWYLNRGRATAHLGPFGGGDNISPVEQQAAGEARMKTVAGLAAMQLLGDTHCAVEGGATMITSEVLHLWSAVRDDLVRCGYGRGLVGDLERHFENVMTYLDVHLESLFDSGGSINSAARHIGVEVSGRSPVLVGRLAVELPAPTAVPGIHTPS